jgi:murein DD-endopeptidase MepM/ murein hydrolase activator NlpD
MHATEPLPEMLAETDPAAVPAAAAIGETAEPVAAPETVAVIPAPHQRVRRRPHAETPAAPAVPVPQAPVSHVSLEPSAAAPPAAEEPAAEAVEAAASTDASDEPVDLFIEAARALNFTGETPIASDVPRPAPRAPRAGAQQRAARRPHPTARRVATVAASIGAFGVVGLLAVGMTTPFSAIASTESTDPMRMSVAAGPAEETDEQIQAFVAPAEVQNAQIERASGYEATTFAEMAAVSGINTANAFYVNDPTADIQWPIVLGTSKSYSFGQRWGRLHEGIDFTPGNGAPVQAIAAGTVRIATESGGAYGVNVYIDHVIDGEMITSHYAHMQYGSLKVVPGQKVEVGDQLGLVGNTGRSFGAHLHFELRLPSGQAIDPMPWLQEHAGVHYPKDDKSEETVAGVDGE